MNLPTTLGQFLTILRLIGLSPGFLTPSLSSPCTVCYQHNLSNHKSDRSPALGISRVLAKEAHLWVPPVTHCAFESFVICLYDRLLSEWWIGDKLILLLGEVKSNWCPSNAPPSSPFCLSEHLERDHSALRLTSTCHGKHCTHPPPCSCIRGPQATTKYSFLNTQVTFFCAALALLVGSSCYFGVFFFFFLSWCRFSHGCFLIYIFG